MEKELIEIVKKSIKEFKFENKHQQKFDENHPKIFGNLYKFVKKFGKLPSEKYGE